MEFIVTRGGLPPGTYHVRFIGAEPFEGNSQYGPAVLLKFRVIAGDHTNEDASRICSANLTCKSSLGKFAVALKGGEIAAGERFNFAAYVGSPGTVLVEATPNGGSRVATFLRAAAPAVT